MEPSNPSIPDRPYRACFGCCDGVDKNKVEKDVNSFLDEFDISISENEKNKLINTLYKNLLEEVKYCEKENKKHS